MMIYEVLEINRLFLAVNIFKSFLVRVCTKIEEKSLVDVQAK